MSSTTGLAPPFSAAQNIPVLRPRLKIAAGNTMFFHGVAGGYCQNAKIIPRLAPARSICTNASTRTPAMAMAPTGHRPTPITRTRRTGTAATAKPASRPRARCHVTRPVSAAHMPPRRPPPVRRIGRHRHPAVPRQLLGTRAARALSLSDRIKTRTSHLCFSRNLLACWAVDAT